MGAQHAKESGSASGSGKGFTRDGSAGRHSNRGRPSTPKDQQAPTPAILSSNIFTEHDGIF